MLRAQPYPPPDEDAAMPANPLTLGLDFGTDSVRALLVDAKTGAEVGTGVCNYPRWAEGKYCNPAAQQFRQHPQDYLDAMAKAVKTALKAAGASAAARVAAIGVDTTGSTPVAVDAAGTPLALLPAFKDDPDAMFVLWKDHTAIAEAERFNEIAHGGKYTDYTRYVGGIYSSEWWWAKIAHVTKANKKVAAAAHSWVEHCDWMPAVLGGVKGAGNIVRGRCAAGHKGCWHESWGGLPDEAFLTAFEPKLKGLRARLFTDTATCDQVAARLGAEWAKRLGLPAGIPIAAGAFDCHFGAVGGGAGIYDLAKVVGTSTCDILLAPLADVGERTVRGICGQVDGSVVPGLLGLEAGQSAFGDVYAWYRRLLLWPLSQGGAAPGKLADGVLPALEKAAAKLAPGASGVTALDWHNGRRTPDANQRLKGAIAGLHLGSDAPAIYRALIEATAFGSRAIVERMVDQGVPVKRVIALGGIAKKSPLVMQVMADALQRPIGVVGSDQACALGSAIAGAVAAGLYPNVQAAQKKMASRIVATYKPNAKLAKAYDAAYAAYQRLGAFAEAEVTGAIAAKAK
jgi:L-ribulokinase